MEAGSICGQGGGDSGAVDIWGGGVVVQNRESPDFRSPEVGASLHILLFLLMQCCTSVAVVCKQVLTQQH